MQITADISTGRTHQPEMATLGPEIASILDSTSASPTTRCH
jgi:hypothetical protein